MVFAVLWFPAAALCLFCGLPPASAATDPPSIVVNEVYYDHPGADAGFEFVELFNPTDSTVSLAGYRLQAGDGAGPGRWRTVWQGAPEDVLPARARLLVGESSVAPVPDRTAVLGLENGPDAVRLVSPDGGQDVVGWGDLTYAEYFAGHPAIDVDAGYSLARAIDGGGSGDNASDFFPLLPPTPAAPNRAERDVAWKAQPGFLSPELVQPGEAITARATLVNRGIGVLHAAEARILLWRALSLANATDRDDPTSRFSPDSLVAETALGASLDPGDSLPVELTWSPTEAGAFRVALTARIEDDGVAGNDRLEGFARCGQGPLVLNEVMYAPPPGEPEWVEVRARGSEAVDLTRFRLADASGRSAGLDERSFAFLEPDSLAVLCENGDALLSSRSDLPRSRVFTLAPWPALNNTSSSPGKPADRLVLREQGGPASDEMSYEGGTPAGYSWERRDPERPGADGNNWGLSAIAGGTALAPNSLLALPAETAAMALSPRVWGRDPEAPPRLRITYRLAWERAVVHLAVLDARGRERGRLADGPSAATGALEWDGRGNDGRPLPPGAYLMTLDAQPAEGGARLRLIEPLVLTP